MRDIESRKRDVIAALEKQGKYFLVSADVAGRPHVIAVSAWWDGHELVVTTNGSSRTARNLAMNPFVKVARVDASIQRLLDDLTETMLNAPGAGLAANQIGVPLRVCVVKGDDKQIWGLVNPEVVKKEGSQVGFEGCLSYPGWVGEVERAETVVVKGRNRHGKEIRIKSSGFTARAFQHELDHLDGVLFTDRLTSLDTLQRVEELIGEEREEAVAAASG